jgi:uncharacterized protein YijF (DUF1287 family)
MVEKMPSILSFVNVLLFAGLLSNCNPIGSVTKSISLDQRQLDAARQTKSDATPLEKILADSIDQTTKTYSYDPSYVKIDYPNGDVPIERGVCADVIIRAFRKAGIDLQKEVYEDMKRNFAKYPHKWGAKRPDPNIDHRRVPNLMIWFDRQKKSLPLSTVAKDYLPGDVVAWEMGGGRLHIGLVSKIKIEGTERHAVVHNIGLGTKLEDVLFDWKIAGHYRYF